MMRGNWGAATNIYLKTILHEDELYLLSQNIDVLNDEIREFKSKFNAKIDWINANSSSQPKLKVCVNFHKNHNVEQIMKWIVNELRMILDKYSVYEFKFSETSKYFNFEDFDRILDLVLHDPNSIITSQKHIPKPDNVQINLIEWRVDDISQKSLIQEENWPFICKICGPNTEVNSTKRLISAFNNIFVSKEITANGIEQKELDHILETVFKADISQNKLKWIKVQKIEDIDLACISYISTMISQKDIKKIEKLCKKNSKLDETYSSLELNEEKPHSFTLNKINSKSYADLSYVTNPSQLRSERISESVLKEVKSTSFKSSDTE